MARRLALAAAGAEVNDETVVAVAAAAVGVVGDDQCMIAALGPLMKYGRHQKQQQLLATHHCRRDDCSHGSTLVLSWPTHSCLDFASAAALPALAFASNHP